MINIICFFVALVPSVLYASSSPYENFESFLEKFDKMILRSHFSDSNKIDSYYLATGQTITDIFKRAQIPTDQTHLAISKLRDFLVFKKLQKGQKFDFISWPDQSLTPRPQCWALKIMTDPLNIVMTKKNCQGEVFVFDIQKKATKVVRKVVGQVQDSFYESFIEQKVPDNVMIKFFELFSFQIDFQRDIWPGDSFSLLYESFYDEKGKFLYAGKILFLSINNRSNKLAYYLFKDNRYYDETGRSISKSLMKTPTQAHRISSGHGRRKHPILGFTRMHKGIDFAASRGAPIWAAGRGRIVFRGWKNGYGRTIKIRHNATYSTLYAHLSRFAKGQYVGKRIKQKDIIGYVGSSGFSTGPHLHYEIIKRGRAVNPLKIRLPASRILRFNELKDYLLTKKKIDTLKFIK